ncbi:MAG TPA: signal peptidase I [Candidatus Limnocylindria bacterium]|nr:signal peptidase I [Candidatus Limnocylindria bacterium]
MKQRYLTRSIAVATLLLFIGAGVGLVAFQARDGKFLSVQTSSMEPNIHKGALVAVTNVSTDRLVAGDVITFTSPADKRQTITHRIIGTLPSRIVGAKPHFITQGDANPQPDAPVTSRSVVGKVQFSVPYVGYGLDFIRKPMGLLLAIYIPALTVIVAEIRRLIAYYKSQEPYVLAEILARRKRRSGRVARTAVPAIAVLLVGTGSMAAPAQAALQSSAVLTGNTISAAIIEPPTPEPEPGRGIIHIKRVFFSCKPWTRKPRTLHILLYNSSRQPVNVSGWTIKAGKKILYTFPADTSIRRKRTYSVKTPIPKNLSHKLGKITLYTASDKKVDSIRWGSHRSR